MTFKSEMLGAWCLYINKRNIGTLHVKFNITEYMQSIAMQGLARCDVKFNYLTSLNICDIFKTIKF
jgi:hypothetical protein